MQPGSNDSLIRTFNIPSNTTGGNLDVSIFGRARLQSNCISSATWGSSFILATKLHKLNVNSKIFRHVDAGYTAPASMWSQPKVLELGAETGLLGIAAAFLWRTHVIVTGLQNMKLDLTINISLNRTQMYKRGGLTLLDTLDWTRPKDLIMRDLTIGEKVLHSPKESKFHIILVGGSACAEKHPRLLSNVIFAWLAPGAHSRVILAYPLREAYLDRIHSLWRLLESGGLQCVENGQVNGEERWNEDALYQWCVWCWQDGPRINNATREESATEVGAQEAMPPYKNLDRRSQD